MTDIVGIIDRVIEDSRVHYGYDVVDRFLVESGEINLDTDVANEGLNYKLSYRDRGILHLNVKFLKTIGNFSVMYIAKSGNLLEEQKMISSGSIEMELSTFLFGLVLGGESM